MRAIPRAPEVPVTIRRAEGDVVVMLKAPPIGHAAMLTRQYPPPQMYLNGKPVEDEAGLPVWRSLLLLMQLAEVMTGDDKPATPVPVNADRAAWHAYGLALKAEFEAAGYVEGDLVELVRGYETAQKGRSIPVGKAPASSPTSAD